MRRAILATGVLLTTAIGAPCADLPVAPARPYAPPAFNWTGYYAGAHVGGGWVRHDWTDSAFALRSDNGTKRGMVVGAQVGGNYQMGPIVLGAEWDLGYFASNYNETTLFVPAIGSNVVVTLGDRWISTLTARAGVAFDQVMIYGKAGGGLVNSRGFTFTNTTTGVTIVDGNHYRTGWLVGGGAEWAFWSHVNTWTVKVEYTYLGLGDWAHTVPATAPFLAGDTFTTANRGIQTVKLGVNFLFNAPVRSRYY